MRSYSRTALLSVFITLLVGGLTLGRWELVAAIVPLVAVIFLETQYRFPSRLQLIADLEIDRVEVIDGDEVYLKVKLENQGPDLMSAEVRMELPEGLHLVDGHLVLPLSIRSGGQAHLGWRVRVERQGRFAFNPLVVRVNDAFHLYERSLRVPLPGSIRASPFVEHLSKVSMRPSMLRPFSGNMRSSMAGPGSEFYCLREYQPGDQLRYINWKASARRDVIITNDPEEERNGDLVILLDLQQAEGDIRDRSIQAAASLSEFWLRERNRMGMIILAEYVDHVPMGMGRRQLFMVNERLMGIRNGTRRAPLSAEKVWKRYFPMKALVVVISPLAETATSLTVKRLVREGARILLLCPYKERTFDDRLEDLADRLVKMRKEDLLFDLMDFCRVVEWDIESPLSRCFMEVRNWRTI
jgi:uncharacterized protein (DUF58 family)